MILDETIKVKTAGKSIKYYRDLGYECSHNTEIEVKIKDLQKGSHVKIYALCDYCKETIFIGYKEYNQSLEKCGKFCCKNCKGIKIKESNSKKYGVENVSQLESIKEKKKETLLEHYGVENPLQSKEILEKVQNTCMKKYGVHCSFMNQEVRNTFKQNMMNKYGVDHPWKVVTIKEKVNNTILERYGVNNISCSNEIKEKKRQISLEKYGTEYTLQSKKVREKITKTLYKNNSQKTSQQQLYLGDLYKGKINYPISSLSADIFLEEDGIDIEYDGGGHNLCVILGTQTQEEFNHKEMVRSYVIKKEGYKQIRIISSKDYLPSDDILLQMLEQAKEYFHTTNHTWFEYNIDSSIMRNAEHKEGVFFDFGELRKIKKIS